MASVWSVGSFFNLPDLRSAGSRVSTLLVAAMTWKGGRKRGRGGERERERGGGGRGREIERERERRGSEWRA